MPDGISDTVTKARINFENKMFAWNQRAFKEQTPFCETCARYDFVGLTQKGVNVFKDSFKHYAKDMELVSTKAYYHPQTNIKVSEARRYVCPKGHGKTIEVILRSIVEVPTGVEIKDPEAK